MNKKGQIMQPGDSSPTSGGPHPLLLLGIFLFVVPFFSTVVKINIPGWITFVGVVVILIGAGLSIARSI